MFDLVIVVIAFVLGWLAGAYGFTMLWEKIKAAFVWVREKFTSKPVA